jgi:hypothetical protein
MHPDDRSNARAVFACGLFVGLAASCSKVDGGAAELSWKLRPASSSLQDKFVDCDSGKPGTNPVTEIRLEWGSGGPDEHDQWPCGDSHGVTGFALPPGPTLFRVVPLCAPDTPAATDAFIAPPAEQRNVILGDTVSLGAIELVVLVSYCDVQPCICH